MLEVTPDGDLSVAWPADRGRPARVVLDVHDAHPLFRSFEINSRVIAENVGLVLGATIGSRLSERGDRYVFFDAPIARPHQRFDRAIALSEMRVFADADRARVVIPGLTLGTFRGDLIFLFYAGSPLVHVRAEVAQPDPNVAYVYDIGLSGLTPPASSVAWVDPDDRAVKRESLAVPKRDIPIHSRMVAAELSTGSLALFPPPHAFFFARDLTDNLKTVSAGQATMVLHQALGGGGAFSPWYDAPPGSLQKLDAFILFDDQPRADPAIAKVLAYTHGDRFVDLPDGAVTLATHFHSRLVGSEQAGAPNGPKLGRVMHEMNVNVLHLAEFHFSEHWDDPGPARLDDLARMYEVAAKYSDDRFVLVPGEEGVDYLGGHYMTLFPKPTYFTWRRADNQPPQEVIAPFGNVHHLANADDVEALLRAEGGRAWTAHPRIKASARHPDAYKDTSLFKDPSLFLGATFKAMPSDLSSTRLGDRAFTLFDDMLVWSPEAPKRLIGEVDVFEIDHTHEVYAHMNVSYIKPERPITRTDWSPLLTALDKGDFFTTTGEVLLRQFEVIERRAVVAEIDWTFPLDHARITWGDGASAHETIVPLASTTEMNRQRFEWPIDLSSAKWVRLEAWDVARNGAYTQARPVL